MQSMDRKWLATEEKDIRSWNFAAGL